jgi:hypothetical protein
MLKEKKKLTTKIESLTRKLQSLQSKIAASKGPAPEPSVHKLISRPVSSASVTSMPRSNPTSSAPPIPPAYGPRTPVSRNRVVSGPASLSRSKTPERRPAQPAVFIKAVTPEKRATQAATPPQTISDSTQVSTSTSVGKKRARPDEFDDVRVPVQALYADQERENVTPRLRRALHSVQARTGFTPVRQGKARTPLAAASPSKRATVGIADVTNSPQSTTSQPVKGGKRSWLGKIRGVSSTSQTSGTRTPSSRHGVFERVPGS